MITQKDLDRLDHLRRKDIPRNLEKREQLLSMAELATTKLGFGKGARVDKHAEYVSKMEELADRYREMQIEEEETILEIMSAIRALPGEYADVIYMRYVKRMSFVSIADETHQSESTVYRRHRKGLDMILHKAERRSE